MNKTHSKKADTKSTFYFSFVILLFAFFSFCNLSCSQNLPDLKSVNSSVIFDYSSEKSFPIIRYSFFVETVSDARRAESIEIQSKSTGYIWKCDELMKIANSKRQWAGYSNFVVPEGLSTPEGTFVIKYLSADGEEAQITTSLSYDNKFKSLTAEEVPEQIKEKNGKNNIAIFNRDSKLLYYGERTKDFKDEASMVRKYREAYYYRDVWITGNNSVMCLMPKTLIKK